MCEKGWSSRGLQGFNLIYQKIAKPSTKAEFWGKKIGIFVEDQEGELSSAMDMLV